jgi:hypothetical protein
MAEDLGLMKKTDNITSSISKAKAEGKSFDEWVKGQGDISYRGQEKAGSEISYNTTGFQGDTQGGVFFTSNKETAKKYGDNVLEYISNKNNTVSVKEADELQKMAEKQVALDIKNQVESDELIEQMALGRPKAFVEYTKKPFIEVGDKMFGEEGEKIFYKEFWKDKTKSQLKAEWDKVKK